MHWYFAHEGEHRAVHISLDSRALDTTSCLHYVNGGIVHNMLYCGISL